MVCAVGLVHNEEFQMKCIASIKSKFINLKEFECNSFVLKAYIRTQEMPDHSSRLIPSLHYEFHNGDIYEVDIDTAKTLIQPYRHCLETSISDNAVIKISPLENDLNEAKLIIITLEIQWLKSDHIAVKWKSGEQVKVESVVTPDQYFEYAFSLKKMDDQWLSSIFASTFDISSRNHIDKAFDICDHDQYVPIFEFNVSTRMIEV